MPARAVSYTHLDVYKRQADRRSGWHSDYVQRVTRTLSELAIAGVLVIT